MVLFEDVSIEEIPTASDYPAQAGLFHATLDLRSSVGL